jgi:FtsP/CotA-like multicopper oxidase with cupredoxin domain
MKMTKNTIGILTLSLSLEIGICQYSPLSIPEAYYGVTGPSGKIFALNIDDNVKQFKTGQATVTGAVNVDPATGNNFWGPTLIMNKGDAVQLNVTNNLNESTTIHWHGMHLPDIIVPSPFAFDYAGTCHQRYWRFHYNKRSRGSRTQFTADVWN